MEVYVIGAGAAGLMAAVSAADAGAAVTLLETMEKPGKKISITGNGRCNLTNRDIQDANFYFSDAPKTADGILKAFQAKDTLHFFENAGLLMKEREGGLIYPYSDQAQSVVNALLQEVRRRKIKLKCQERVLSIEKKKARFYIKTEGWHYEADRVILTCGGKAAPATGSDGNGYALAKTFGHTVIEPLPALVPLTAKLPFGSLLDGVRSRAKITLFIDGKVAGEESGELQWTGYGLSGIAVFQLSSRAVRALQNKKKVRAEIDLLPDFSEKELLSRIQKREGSYEEVLGGFYHAKVLKALLKEEKASPGEKALPDKAASIIKKSRQLSLTITGSKTFEQAQVTTGGIPLKELDEHTLESKKVKGLYLAGELINVDGPCGGYNLQWAWASGHIAGVSAGKGDL